MTFSVWQHLQWNVRTFIKAAFAKKKQFHDCWYAECRDRKETEERFATIAENQMWRRRFCEASKRIENA